jgi:hypothetical protein
MPPKEYNQQTIINFAFPRYVAAFFVVAVQSDW